MNPPDDSSPESEELHITPDMAAGRHYAGDELPLGALLLGIARQGRKDVGALLMMPAGLWVRYNAGRVHPLPPAAGAQWLQRVRAQHRLTIEECAALAGVREATFAAWEQGAQRISPNHVRRFLRALQMLGKIPGARK